MADEGGDAGLGAGDDRAERDVGAGDGPRVERAAFDDGAGGNFDLVGENAAADDGVRADTNAVAEEGGFDVRGGMDAAAATADVELGANRVRSDAGGAQECDEGEGQGLPGMRG